MNRINPPAILTIFLAFSCLANAEVYQSDDFDYSKGPLQGQDGGEGWNGPWETAGMGNANASNFDLGGQLPAGYGLLVAPNVLQLLPIEKSQKATRKFSSPMELSPSSPMVYYFSFIFCRVDGSDQQGYEVFGFSFSSGSNRILGFDLTSNENLQISYAPLKKSAAGQKKAIQFTDSPKTSPRYLFVGRITANPTGQEDRFDFAVFDTNRPVESEPQTWDLSLQEDASDSLEAIDFIVAPFLRNILIDNIRIGSDFSSVTRP